MTCKDCIHYDLCDVYRNGDLYQGDKSEKCACFKDKSRFVELPCKIGDEIYIINKGSYYSNSRPFVQEKTIHEISWKYDIKKKDLGFGLIAGARYKMENVGKTVFLTREEAEAKLNEKQK